MQQIPRFTDGLVNVVANLRTERDKAAHSRYVNADWTAAQLLTCYRNSWLSRSVVDYPAEDSVRKWRSVRADKEQIELIEAQERRLGLKRHVQEALVAARLYGGAAIYINTAEADQEVPLRPGQEVKSLVVLTRNTLRPASIVKDINSIYYGRAEYYVLTSGEDAKQIRIHASRLAVFRGASLPGDSMVNSLAQGWGDSVLQSTIQAIMDTDSTMANMASLVFEAKVDVFQFDGFAQMLEDAGNDEKLSRRLSTQAAMKGINGAVVIDKLDAYEQKSASFAGLPEVVSKFMDAVAGASRIPVTRLYGRAAVGLSGSGDGDERVYFDRIGHVQATEIQPALDLLDDCIIYQALGSRPPEIYFEWRPLRQLTENEQADVFLKTANAARAIAGAQAGELLPIYALSDSLANVLTEQGVLPGLDQGIEKYGNLAGEGIKENNEDLIQ